MRKIWFSLWLLLSLMLSLCRCQMQFENAENISEVSAASQNAEYAEAEAPDKADYFDRVFDTSQDAGRLTARYLYLQTVEGEGTEDKVYTGDCTVYTSPDGLTMLADCGNTRCGQAITDQLKELGVDKIDILVLSHPHADHIGGFVTVAENFEIGQVYVNGHEYDTKLYETVMEKIGDLQIPCETLADGDSFQFGELVNVQVFSPAKGVAAAVNDDVTQQANDASIAMRLTYRESSFWTSGDLYSSAETVLVETYGDQIQSDVVKMNHHGHDTSNSKAYVETQQAKVAVAMLDYVSSKAIAYRYIANGAQVFYNCADGAIRVSTTGDGTYDVQTQMLREVRILPDPAADGHYVIE